MAESKEQATSETSKHDESHRDSTGHESTHHDTQNHDTQQQDAQPQDAQKQPTKTVIKTTKIVKKVLKKKLITKKVPAENQPPSEPSSSSSESAHEGEGAGDEDDQIGGAALSTAAVAIDREEYLQAHRDLTYDRQHDQILNNLLHRRLAEYYKKRKCEHVLKALDGAVDLEDKYQQKLLVYEDLKLNAERELSEIKSKLNEVEEKYMARLDNANSKFDELQQLERSTGSGLIYSRKGKPIADKTVERFLLLQRRKAEQASALCLRHVRARNAVSELEAIVKKLETLGPGLYVYQYEQLNIDNQNYNTKIEEREDELIKHRAKCTEHNQILAHIREKMHHTDEVIDFAECDLGDAEMDYFAAREELGSVKSRRNKLRWSLEEERLKAGLLTRKDLLRDFQASMDEVLKMERKKKMLEMQVGKTANNLREARKSVQIQSKTMQAQQQGKQVPPKAAPEAASKAAPQAASQASPKADPQAAPQVTAQAISKAAPKA